MPSLLWLIEYSKCWDFADNKFKYISLFFDEIMCEFRKAIASKVSLSVHLINLIIWGYGLLVWL